MPSAQTTAHLTAEQAAVHVTTAILQQEDLIGHHGDYPINISETLLTIIELLKELHRGERVYPALLGLAETNGVTFSDAGHPHLTAGFLLALMESSSMWDEVMKHGPQEYCYERLNMLRTAVYALLFKRSLAS